MSLFLEVIIPVAQLASLLSVVEKCGYYEWIFPVKTMNTRRAFKISINVIK